METKNAPDFRSELMPMNHIKIGKNSRLAAADHLEDLMQSIKRLGLLQPIGVKKNGTGYEIVAGNRRFLACSKLGWSKIPAIVLNPKDQIETDLMNLAENIQRRNISLIEAGRYFDALTRVGFNKKEICVAVGVNIGFVEAAITTFKDVPADYQHKIVQQGKGGSIAKKGEIPFAAARAILSERRSNRLSRADTKKLFEAAAEGKPFNKVVLKKYASNLKAGRKIDHGVDDLKFILTSFSMSINEYNDLMSKYVEEGPFNNFHGLIRAILKGEKNIRIRSIGIKS